MAWRVSSNYLFGTTKLKDFRSMIVRRNPELFLSLPAKTQDELRQRSHYVAIMKEIEGLSLQINAAETKAAVYELKSRHNQLLEQKAIAEE
jgi:hypothetical protein